MFKYILSFTMVIHDLMTQQKMVDHVFHLVTSNRHWAKLCIPFYISNRRILTTASFYHEHHFTHFIEIRISSEGRSWMQYEQYTWYHAWRIWVAIQIINHIALFYSLILTKGLLSLRLKLTTVILRTLH